MVRKEKSAWPLTATIAVFLSLWVLNTAEITGFTGLLSPSLLLAGFPAGLWRAFHNRYLQDVRDAMDTCGQPEELVTTRELETLPLPVQSYLRYVGVVGKPKVRNVRIRFEGQMREKGGNWFDFTSEQYNFFGKPARHFFMKARIKGLPVQGYHCYTDNTARMQIRLLSVFPLVDHNEPQMFPTETVTFFNDMCLFAPAALLSSRIDWETVDEYSVKATFTNEGTSISAVLTFNEAGQLINFLSEDRYSVAEMKAFPFSTPAKDYRNINHHNLCTYGEGVWHYPEGEFVYGRFNAKEITYNVCKI